MKVISLLLAIGFGFIGVCITLSGSTVFIEIEGILAILIGSVFFAAFLITDAIESKR